MLNIYVWFPYDIWEWLVFELLLFCVDFEWLMPQIPYDFYPGIYADKSRYATTDAAILNFA